MHYLYRHFDSEDRLLYVGISLSAINRLSQHKANSAWFAAIKRVEVQRFSTKNEAANAERMAIAKEGPLYNIQFSALHRRRGKEPGLAPVALGDLSLLQRKLANALLYQAIRTLRQRRNMKSGLNTYANSSATTAMIGARFKRR